MKKKLISNVLVLLFACFVVNNAFAGKNKSLKKAMYYYEYNNYSYALPYFYEYYKLDTTNRFVNNAIGTCIFFSQRDKSAAIKYFETAKDSFPDTWFYLAQLYHSTEQIDKAILYYKSYKSISTPKTYTDSVVDVLLTKSYTAKKMIRDAHDIKMKNLGASVNSPYPDYVPVISPDETILFFTSRRKGIGEQKDPNGEYFEDVYFSIFEGEEWGQAKNIGWPINTETHDACLGVSHNMETMYLYRTNAEGTGGGIYESHFKDNKWTAPQWVDADFNAKSSDEKIVCLTASFDSTVYYFVSNRPGGYGGTDIYRVTRFANGSWGVPENLGPTINTPYDEDAPYFHPDEETMFFSSRGHENMGDFDIFKTTKQTDGMWSKPENVGYPINTVGDDRFLMVSPDGRRGYYSSSNQKNSFGASDIYVFEMPYDQLQLAVVRGAILDADTQQSIPAEITVIDTDANEVYGIYRPNQLTARYVILLRQETQYRILVKSPGYEDFTTTIFVPIQYKDMYMNSDIYLTKRQ